jgi:8-amino-7-oxononanoate synthase
MANGSTERMSSRRWRQYDITTVVTKMNAFEQHLDEGLAEIRESNLYRELRRMDSAQSTRIQNGGREVLNFSSNDYLGLANHPALKAAAIQAVERYGAGAGASRLICGSLEPHHELEELLAEFKRVEAALTFATGYAAAMGALCSLVGKEDIIVIDKLVHASIVDAAKLSGAKLRVFAHNDLNELEEILKWAHSKSRMANHASRTLIVTESVFSMDGDHAPLRDIVELKEKCGAWLMVDEAHATGLYGAHRRGLAEELGVGDQIEVQMGTLGKALGAAGGYICGSRKLLDYLVNRARSLIFSTAPVPAAVAAATSGIELVKSPEGESRRDTLWQNVSELKSKLDLKTSNIPAAIIPLVIGDEAKAMEMAAALLEKNILIPAVRYPSVARGKARLRLTVSAAHTVDQIDQLAKALRAADFKNAIPQNEPAGQT